MESCAGDKQGPLTATGRPSRGGRLRRAGGVVALMLLTGVITTGFLLQRHRPMTPGLMWGGVAATLAGAALVLERRALRHREQWAGGLADLDRTLAQVRGGEAPIDDLEKIGPPFTRLSGQIAEIMRELRRQRLEMAQLNNEMRQRVAQRTDALERLVGSLRLQASRDALTGLYNRRMLDEHLGTLVDQARADGQNLCLLMLDLDNFKTLNDTLGHAAGDEFLRSVGQIIRSTIREGDLAFRCGGDEFVIIVPRSGREAGQTLRGRLVSLVDGLGKTYKLPRPLGLSAGLATLSQQNPPTSHALLACADRWLYQTKAHRKGAAAHAA